MLRLKTEMEALEDMRKFLLKGAVGEAIGGTVYIAVRDRDGAMRSPRPDNATTEDCVISLTAGQDTLLQVGTFCCNIYCQDIVNRDGEPMADTKRLGELERALWQFLWDFPASKGYQLSTDGTPTVEWADNGQHCVHAMVRFARRAS